MYRINKHMFTSKNSVIPLIAIIGLIVKVNSWDPDAGLVKSWTKFPGVTVSATSGNNSAHLVLDNNDNTHWTSDSCLPLRYVNDPFSNVLLWLCNASCEINSADDSEISKITDGSLYTLKRVPVNSNGTATLALSVGGLSFKRLSLWGKYNDVTTVVAVDSTGSETILKTLNTNDNYKEVRIILTNSNISKILVHSNNSFDIKEASALNLNGCPSERITVDLGVQRKIRSIRTRHWAGPNAASAAKLLLSTDGLSWVEAKSLIPGALHAVLNRIDSPTYYRYIAIEYHVNVKDYLKVYCWEIDAWDEFYLWGPPLSSNPNPISMRQLLGVNGIWGWGHNKYSYLLQNGEGPYLYNQIASNARNYHNMNWDVKDPDFDPNYENMATEGTNASSWLDWDKEYNVWVSANLSIDASIQMVQFQQSSWDNPRQSAFHFGQQFAKHFGPQIGNGNISAMEVGNEPWGVTAGFYTDVLESMAAGARSVDQMIHVLPGAFQAYKIPETEPTSGNYIGNRVTQAASVNISVLNTHAYSFMSNENGVRIGTYPEHIDSSFNSIRNMIRWRNTNMPTKPIWLTEWGWDADGGDEDCKNTECVSESAQAIYGARGLLIIARYGIERAVWYFYANTKTCDTLFCRSGLTTSKLHSFSKKAVFTTFEKLLEKIGDQHFLSVLNEDKNGYIYLFGKVNSTSNSTVNPHFHIVAWNPIAVNDISVVTTSINLPSSYIYPTEAWQLTGIKCQAIVSTALPNKAGSTLTIKMSAKPVIIALRYIYNEAIG